MKKKPRVILMGRKPGAGRALMWLLKKRINVPFVVASKNETGESSLSTLAHKHEIPVIADSSMVYEYIDKMNSRVKDIDLVVSYLFPERIREPLIKLGRLGCVNYHPAPLPDYKSRAGYNTAILEDRKEYGVSVHFIDSEEFDAGPIVEVVHFPITEDSNTAYTLEKEAQGKLFALFAKTMPQLLSGNKVKTTRNVGGLYLTSTQLEKMKTINATDSVETIDRKVRAFFFPPYQGALIEIAEKKYTVMNDEVLRLIHKLFSQKK
jgi:methionyl-tRNA formyltransferase